MFLQMSDGANLFVELIGDAPDKPLLIAHHGGPGVSYHGESKSSFEFLSDRFRVLVFDARGSGQSDDTPPLTHARLVADVDELRQWAGAETFVMAGGSYGGFITLEYALAHPDRVSAIILRDTSANAVPLAARSIEYALNSDRVTVDPEQLKRTFAGKVIDEADMVSAMESILPLYPGAVDEDSAGVESVGVAPALRFKTHNAFFSGDGQTFNVVARLGEIRAPTLVVVGRHDWITPVSCSEEIQAGIPGAELVVFEESGHSPPADEPALFQATVRKFLNSGMFEIGASS
jgi:proline iminopeptidase